MSQVLVPKFDKNDIPKFKESEVLEIMQSLDTSKSTRGSDIPAKVLKRFSQKLHKPLGFVLGRNFYWVALAH